MADRGASPSLKALTGATVGTIAEDRVAFVIGVMEGLLEVPDLDVAGVVADVDTSDAFEDLMACD